MFPSITFLAAYEIQIEVELGKTLQYDDLEITMGKDIEFKKVNNT
jgi:hypothetical protein